VKALLDEARGVRAQSGPIAPRPSLMALSPRARAGGRGLARAQEWKAALRRETLRPAPVPGFARVAGPVRPGIVPIHLEEPAVAALVRAARDNGASVTASSGRPSSSAARSLFDARAGEAPALMLTSPVDLRASLSAAIDDATPGST